MNTSIEPDFDTFTIEHPEEPIPCDMSNAGTNSWGQHVYKHGNAIWAAHKTLHCDKSVSVQLICQACKDYLINFNPWLHCLHCGLEGGTWRALDYYTHFEPIRGDN